MLFRSEKQERAYAVTPERPNEKPSETKTTIPQEPAQVKKRLWYCKQCGYVVFREDPPYICPICKAKRELFAEIDIRTNASG